MYKLSIVSRDKSDIQTALDGGKYLSCLYDITNFYRDKQKHSDDPNTRWDIVYELLWQILNDHRVDPFNE